MSKDKRSAENQELRKAILFFNIIVQHIKTRYRKTKRRKDRRYISSLIRIMTSYRTIRQLLNSLETAYDISLRRTLIKSTKIKEAEFFERDDNSRVKTDKLQDTNRRNKFGYLLTV